MCNSVKLPNSNACELSNTSVGNFRESSVRIYFCGINLYLSQELVFANSKYCRHGKKNKPFGLTQIFLKVFKSFPKFKFFKIFEPLNKVLFRNNFCGGKNLFFSGLYLCEWGEKLFLLKSNFLNLSFL